jgi:acyl carrier protein
MSTLDTIKQAAAEAFDVDAAGIDMDAPFDQVGIDSLGLVEFIFDLEDRFGVRLDPNQSSGLKTLRELAAHIDSLLAAKAAEVV